MKLLCDSIDPQGGNPTDRNDQATRRLPRKPSYPQLHLPPPQIFLSLFFFAIIISHLTPHQPIPVEYLRLGSFSDPPTTRSRRPDSTSIVGGSFLASIAGSSNRQDIYPFTVWHAAARTTRRYTVYVGSEGARRRWRDALVDAVGVRKVRGESNMVSVVLGVRRAALVHLIFMS